MPGGGGLFAKICVGVPLPVARDGLRAVLVGMLEDLCRVGEFVYSSLGFICWSLAVIMAASYMRPSGSGVKVVPAPIQSQPRTYAEGGVDAGRLGGIEFYSTEGGGGDFPYQQGVTLNSTDNGAFTAPPERRKFGHTNSISVAESRL